MANKTIYGCVDRTTGVITFEGEACDSGDYEGCLETTGIHTGQVKVVINDGNCDDTYYTCFNPTTGKFQLVIPDNCCDCTSCWPGALPDTMTVTLSGLSSCYGDHSCEMNICSEHTLSYIDNCVYRKTWFNIVNNFIVFDMKSPALGYGCIYAGSGDAYILYFAAVLDNCDLSGSIGNILVAGDCGDPVSGTCIPSGYEGHHYGGTATWDAT